MTQHTSFGHTSVSFPGSQVATFAPPLPSLALPSPQQQASSGRWRGNQHPSQSSSWHHAEWDGETEWQTADWYAAPEAAWEESSDWSESNWDQTAERRQNPAPTLEAAAAPKATTPKATAAPKRTVAPSRSASSNEAPPPSPEDTRGEDPLHAFRAREDAAKRADRNNWLENFIKSHLTCENFRGIEVYADGSSLEFFTTSSTGQVVRVAGLQLQLPGNLQQYNSATRHGDPRTLGQILNSDCNQRITDARAPWRGDTFEQVAQAHSAECDNLVDTHDEGMFRHQISLRVYLALRRQLFFELRWLKQELKRKNYVGNLD